MLANKYLERRREEAIAAINLNKDRRSIMKSIDQKQLADICAGHKSDSTGYSYFNATKNVPRDLRRAYTLGQHRANSLKILDTGKGSGLLPYSGG